MPPRSTVTPAEKEALIQEALNAIMSGEIHSAYAAEKRFGISRVLLSRRLKDTQQTSAKAHETQQMLMHLEEEALVRWCSQLTIAGYPARHSVVREMAEEIRRRRIAAVNSNGETLVTYPPLGVKWSSRFLKQHPHLTTVVSQQLDLARWKDPSREVLAHWFTVFSTVTATINPQNIYSMDETGFGIGTDECSRVIIDQSILKTRYKTHPGRQGWVSVVECICADGTTVTPLFFFLKEKESTPIALQKQFLTIGVLLQVQMGGLATFMD